MPAPVALFTYRRPQHTRATLRALEGNTLAGQTQLFVFSDGPKGPADAEGVESVRETIRQVSGFAAVTLVERPGNMGLARSVIAGVTELLEQHPQIIVLEDDLVTSKHFLAYMNRALDNYREDPCAFSVTGHTYPAKYLHIPDDYPYDTYASYRCSSWSWGTWRDRWRRVDWEMGYFPGFCADRLAQERFNRGGQDMVTLLKLQHERRIDSWAIRFCYAHHASGMRCIYPARTLVRNIGLDNSGTHSKPEPRYFHPALDESWVPERFCPADRADPRIAEGFRAIFDPPTPSRSRVVLRRAKSLVRLGLDRGRSAVGRFKRAVLPSIQNADILVVNTLQKSGGAARAAYRIFLGIRRAYPGAQYLTLLKEDLTPGVWGRHQGSIRGLMAQRLARLDQIPLRRYPKRSNATFTPAFWSNPLRIPLSRFRSRLYHLNWVAASMLRVEELASLKAPVVWTLHDAWAFTGGCHYAGTCERFRMQCGQCPQLGSADPGDASHSLWQRKQTAYAATDLTIVTPSHWLAGLARRSSLLSARRIEVIPNGLDTDVFKPIDKSVAKAYFGLPPGDPVLLFGAQFLTDRRKGGDLLVEALEQIDFRCTLLVFGIGDLSVATAGPVTVKTVGSLNDDISLAMTYSAADVFVCPSREDNLPNTVAEALACATPCVAFDVNGLPEMIEHRKNGWLARPFDSADLAAGIRWIATHPNREQLARAARDKALAEYGLQRMSERYARLYAELLSSHRP